MSLVRAAWERRPEGPAYLPSNVMLLYLAGQCAYFSTHFPLGSVELGGFFPSSCGRILSAVPEFEIQDLSPLAVASSERESTVLEARVP